jgi:cytochrome c2
MRKIVSDRRVLACAIAVVGLLSTIGCGSASTESASANAGAAPASAPAEGLTPFQTEHGIGPVTDPIVLTQAVDKSMAKNGHEVFEEKCSACHKMDERYVGPALGGVIGRRSPTFVMNMALNPQGMMEKHPVTKKLLAEYLTAMPNQNLTRDEARQVVEYLRTQSPGDGRERQHQ